MSFNRRVKLNRNTFKDVNNELPAVPRRRRSSTLCSGDLTRQSVGKTNVTLQTRCTNDLLNKSALVNTLASSKQNHLPCEGQQVQPGVADDQQDVGFKETAGSRSDNCEGEQSPVSQCKGIHYFECVEEISTLKIFEVQIKDSFTRSKHYHTRNRSAQHLNKGHNKCLSCRPQQWPVGLCFYGDSRKRQINKLRTKLTSRGEKVKYSIKCEEIENNVTMLDDVQNENRDARGEAQKAPRQPCASTEKKSSFSRKRNSSDKALKKYYFRPLSRNRDASACVNVEEGSGRMRQNVAKVVDGGKGMRGSIESSIPVPVTHVEQDVNSSIIRGRAVVSKQRAEVNVAPHCHKPNLLAKAENSARRAVKSSLCLCGDIRYTPPKRKDQVQVHAKCRSTGPEQPKVRVKTTRTNSTYKARKKLIIWTGDYPMVELCNLAIHGVSPQDFRCTLPAGLTTKVVHCFKQDLGTGVLGPYCLGRERYGSEEADILSRNREPQRLTGHQQTLTGAHTVVLTNTNPTASLSLEDGTSEDSASLLGTQASGAGLLDRDVEEDSGAGNDLIATEKRGAKRRKLDRSGRGATASLAPDQNGSSATESVMSSDSQSCLDAGISYSDASDTPVRTHGSEREDGGQRKNPGGSDTKLDRSGRGATASLAPDRNGSSVSDLAGPSGMATTVIGGIGVESGPSGMATTVIGGIGVESVMSSDSQSCLDAGISYSDASGSPVRTHGLGREDGDQRKEPGGSDTSRESSENGLFSLSPDENRIGPNSDSEPGDLFSCQRATPFVKRLQLSCARTYFPWPFPKRDPPSVMCAGETPPAGPIEWSADTGLGYGDRCSSVPTERLTVILPHGATDTTPSTSYHPSPQSIGNVQKATSSFRPVQEPLASPSVPRIDTFSPNEDLTRTDMDTLSPDPASTPSAIGLSDTDTATASSSPMHFSTSDNTNGLSPTPSSASPSSNKDMTQGRSTASTPTLSSLLPISKHRDAAHAMSDLIPLSDCSETDRGSIESYSPPHHSLQPLGDFHLSESSPFPPTVEKEPLKEWGTEEEVVKDFPHHAFCSSQEGEQHEDHLIIKDPTIESGLGSPLSTKPREGVSEMDADVPLPIPPPEASTPILSATIMPLQTQSYLDEEEGSKEDHVEDECGESQPSSSSSFLPLQCQDSGSQSLVELFDELAAYEQDILVLSADQDDPELFGNMPEQSLLGLGPTRGAWAPGARTTSEVITTQSRSGGTLCGTKKSLTTGAIKTNGAKRNQRKVISFNEGEGDSRSLRTQSSSQPPLMPSNSWPHADVGLDTEVELPDQLDSNNNMVNEESSERILDIQTLMSLNSTMPALMNWCNGDGQASQAMNPIGDIRQSAQKAQYCRFYFNENRTCSFKNNCFWLHLPIEGDEKFCVESVLRFSNPQNLVALQKAVAVFTGYYQSNPLGAYFTPPVLSCLLSALLKAGFVSDIIAVLRICATHKILPHPDFFPALYDYVREKGQHTLMPELMHLKSKMEDTSVDSCARVLNCLEFHTKMPQMDTLIPASAKPRSHNMPTRAEPMTLAQAILEVELCGKKEDWRQMGAVFLSVFHSHNVVSELQRLSSCVAIALISVTKPKVVMPFATFCETVCQDDCEDGVVKAFLGRIGVSLMCRYHKTQQWVKGRRAVEVLSRLKVDYSTLKGLFVNEDQASRCCLVTQAADLFLHSGSVEGALNSLQDNEWFLSSSTWPCEPVDVVERSNMLVRLAMKTSQRDRLEVLTHLPGLKEPTDMADTSQYVGLFNTHLRACVENKTLIVASNTLDFMLSKALAVHPPLLPELLHKLGKMNLWLQARAHFKRALSVGYYPGLSALPGSLVLTVPCLGEIELALAFEFFVTVNATVILNTADKEVCLKITLKRSCDSESEYLSAGSHLLSAASITRPKLIVRYQGVNSSKEQTFTLQIPSAQRWLKDNCSWANKQWTPSS